MASILLRIYQFKNKVEILLLRKTNKTIFYKIILKKSFIIIFVLNINNCLYSVFTQTKKKTSYQKVLPIHPKI